MTTELQPTEAQLIAEAEAEGQFRQEEAEAEEQDTQLPLLDLNEAFSHPIPKESPANRPDVPSIASVRNTLRMIHNFTQRKITKNGHYYIHTPSKKRLDSVTTILDVIHSEAIEKWKRNKVHEAWVRVLKSPKWQNKIITPLHVSLMEGDVRILTEHLLSEAAERGKEKHSKVELSIKALINKSGGMQTQMVMDDSYVSEEGNAIIEWMQENEVAPLECELKVCDFLNDVAGTIDILGYSRQGRILVLDIKTGARTYPENFYQISAYRYAVSKTSGFPLDLIDCIILHVPDKIVDAKLDPAPDKSFATFHSIVAANAHLRTRRKWR